MRRWPSRSTCSASIRTNWASACSRYGTTCTAASCGTCTSKCGPGWCSRPDVHRALQRWEGTLGRRLMAVTTRVGTPTLDEVVARAEALLPRLRERARTAEVERHVPTETVQELRDAGLFRVLQPASYGGYELDYGRTQVELCHVLGQACGSTAWVQCVVACHAWCLAMFPPEAQEAVWGQDQDTLIASAFAFKTGRGRPVEGGYRVEGEWQFSSGSDICEWIILGTPIFEEGAERPSKVIWALLRRP